MFYRNSKTLVKCLATVALWMGISANLSAAPLNIANAPLFITQAVPPLVMLVMGRDHKIYYEAYNDTSDLNGDGVLDIGYNPAIDYAGYFDSYKCYNYDSGSAAFSPQSVTSTKKCSGQWSGDFLNYLTMSRMDVMRSVLYGGYRSTDSATNTILERSYIPQDAHSWGKEYTSVAVNGYLISDYTPYGAPGAGLRHLFANTTLLNTTNPRLRVSLNQSYRIWEWLSIERPVAGNRVLHGGTGPDISGSITDFDVRVKVCVSGLLEQNCRPYLNGNYKPTGLLQTFGESDAMKFGLITGSYGKNKSGGVLRKNIASINDEIDPNTGVFTNSVGIIKTIDRLKVTGFAGNYEHNSNCGFIFSRDYLEGECRLWGNPIAEMMYESIRYFAGKGAPTSAFVYSGGDDAALGLPLATWQDPYANNANPWCAKPSMMVISDINPSYDTDQVPGSHFNSVSGDLSPSLNASGLGQTIWNQEYGASQLHFIGQSGNNNDAAPTAKTVTSFGNIRGLSPEEPNKQGGYYAASVAYYGWLNDVNAAQGAQKIQTYTIALASPIPQIKIPVGGNVITLVPFGKSVGPAPPNCLGGINKDEGQFQPTNTIVDFYVEQLTATSGTFRINFEDAQQGADHDMDAVVKYTYQVNGNNTVTITLDSTYAAGCIVQHMGYVISGTTQDGTYLEVRDNDTAAGSDVDYFLDTPPGQNPGGTWSDNQALPLTATRIFTPSSNPAATLLKNPLWYAAKWGSFEDSNGNNVPDLADEWDVDNNGKPDNYFLVTNAATLQQQLTTVLEKIIDKSSSATSASINSGTLNNDTRLYQAIFNSSNWSGQVLSFKINTSDGTIDTSGPGPKGSLWDAGLILSTQAHDTGREIITYKPSAQTGVPFVWPANPNSPTSTEMDIGHVTALHTNPTTNSPDNLGEKRLNYIRGDTSEEAQNGGAFRDRATRLGDIVNSSPLFVGHPQFYYPDTWGSGAPENAAPYSAFKTMYYNRKKVLYMGANDGMLHAIDAETGAELLAYVPSTLIQGLPKLTDKNYSHMYYVDGSANMADVFFNGAWHTVLSGGLNAGGQSIYTLNITNPAQFDEANAADLVLWEFTDSDDADLGYTFSQPAIVRLGNGQWGAIFGNGYNNTVNDGNVSTTGNAVLYIVDIANGNLIKKLDTGVGMIADPLATARPNGLSTPAVVDTDGDHIADYVYAGDLFGNLWKFDIRDANPSNWDVAFSGAPLFSAQYNIADLTTRQSIVTRPNVSKIPGVVGGLQIYFGTGKYFEGSDKTTLDIQTFYAIRDNHTTPVTGRVQLKAQSILSEVVLNQANGETAEFRITSNDTLSGSDRGWYLDLIYNNNQEGERSVSDPIIRNGKIIFTTLIPSDDPCEYGGTGWLIELSALNGGRLPYSPFDVNQDNVFNSGDYVNITINGETTQVPTSGKKSNVGIIPKPGIISDGDTEYKYTPGTSGQIQTTRENPGVKVQGRQSWRRLR